MAASSTNTIRVRLYFDYPPPAVSDCRMCWVLVDLNKCRVVADLASIIREKFDYSRRNILNLFIEDCYLPHTESIYVVRDNDSIRVKVDSTTQVNGLDTSSGHAKKRGRDTDDEETAENRMSVAWKKKKTKRKQEESERESNHAADSERNTNKQKKKKENKKRKMEEKQVTTKQTASVKGAPPTSAQPVKNTKKARAPAINGKAKTQNVSSTDSSDSSSEEEEAPCKTTSQKTLPKTPTSTSAAPVVSKVTPKGKVTATKPQPPPPSSSDSSSDTASSDEASRVKPPLKKTPLAKPTTTPAITTPTTSKVDTQDKTTPSRLQPGLPSSVPTTSAPAQRPIALGSTLAAKKATQKPESSDSDSSEEEIKLVIKRPIQGMGMGMGLAPAAGDPNLRGRGRGSPRGMERGRGRGQGQRLGEGRGGTGPLGGGRGGRGGGDGGPRGDQGFHFNYETGQQQQHQPSYLSDSLTNNSVVLRNPAEGGPKRDYSIMPQLASPPPVGQRIAFKLLELTENYTPEVSEYKEGRIISFDYSTKQIELQLLSASQGHVEPGKFDLVYQNADGSESVEYAVSRGSRVTERWDSLLEPRLIVDN